METLWWLPSWAWWKWSLLVVVGLVCGFINTLAGGGSLLTMPVLIFLGLPPQVANATNRLALVGQTVSATVGFLYHGVQDKHSILWLAIPSLLGSGLGAQLAVILSPDLFRKVFAILLLLAAIPTVWRADTLLMPPVQSCSYRYPSWRLRIIFFFVGLYSGFIQIGIGIWSMLALIWIGQYHVNQANLVKAQLLFLTTALSTLIFLFHDQVNLWIGLILGTGNALGAWIATWLAKGRDISWIRWLLLACAVAACLRLFDIL